MSILKYFKRAPAKVQDEELPEPTSSLNSVVPSKAIELANSEVLKLKNKGPRGARSAPYLILTPAQRYEVGKRAAEHGVTASLRYFAKKYPELPLKETSVQRLKNLYQCDCKQLRASNAVAPVEDVHELPRKKEGGPLLLPDELDLQVQEYLKELRKRSVAH